MKKSNIASFIAGAMIFGSIGVFAGQYNATENPFPIRLNGSEIWMEGYNINGSTYFKLRDIANTIGGFTVDFWDNTIELSKDGYIYDHSIRSTEELSNGGLSSSDINSIKQSLNVPSDLDVSYEVGEKYYWPSGERYLIYVSFYHNGEIIAGAAVDSDNLEIVRDILTYNGD